MAASTLVKFSTRADGILRDLLVGGGQVGRLLSLLNIPVVILEVGASASAKQIFALTTTYLSHIDGSFTDLAKIRELAAKVDVLTVEIDHIDVDVLEEAQRQRTDEMGVEVHPAPSTVDDPYYLG